MFLALAKRFHWSYREMGTMTLAQLWAAYTERKTRDGNKITGEDFAAVNAIRQGIISDRKRWVANVVGAIRGNQTA